MCGGKEITKMVIHFKLLLFILLLFLFLWQSFIPIQKFSRGNTSMFTSVEEEDTLLYPSVTVCKKYTFVQYIDNIILNESVTLGDTKAAIAENAWKREKVFYFLSHPKMENLTFPCTYNLGRWN